MVDVHLCKSVFTPRGCENCRSVYTFSFSLILIHTVRRLFQADLESKHLFHTNITSLLINTDEISNETEDK